MATKSQLPKGRDSVLSSLNVAIDALNHAEGATGMTQAKVAFTSAGVLLTTIRDSMISKADYVELGLACASVCEALNRGIHGRQADQLSQSVLEAIEKLTMTIAEIQRHAIERSKRNGIFRRYHAKDDKEAIATRRLDLERILRIFNTDFVINTHPIVSEVRSDIANTRTTPSDIRRDKLKSLEDAGSQNQANYASAPGNSPSPLPKNTHGAVSDVRRDAVSKVYRDLVDTQTAVYNIQNMLKSQEGSGSQPQLTQKSAPGELPPPPPRVLFGRDELIEEIIHFAERLTPIALIGAGGIGKTSIILTILHDDRIKQRFGDNRCFIRCDQFPPSQTHLLRQLSKVVGAEVENPEDIASLRRYLSSKEMVIVLDNAESVLDPQGTSAQDIHAIVDELTRFSNIWLCVTSRISTIPPDCETVEIPTLSMEAAHNTFYRIYKHGGQSDPVNDILEQLDFHPLSVTLLATVAQYNKWNTNRLTTEWERQRTGVLHAQPARSLATTIELSLTSPMFRELGPDARGLLQVVAFFPQGVDEKNISWLFPTISDGQNMFDKFCTLSLTHRTSGFITMLAPLRDYLRPKNPMSSPLLDATKENYFARLSVDVHPEMSSFEEARWIMSEDVNVEHLLDVFTSTDANSENVWKACANFTNHLYWHKPQLIMLGPKIEALPDDYPPKAWCLENFSLLVKAVGNLVEHKRLLTHALKLWREQGDDRQVARALSYLSDTNRLMDLCEEGIQQAEEASSIYEQLGDTANQAGGLIDLAWALYGDEQFDAAEDAASRAINLISGKGYQSVVCQCHHVLGDIYRSKGETEKAIHHHEVSLATATSLGMVDQAFWVHFSLVELFSEEGRFNDAQTHVERAKSYAVNDTYNLARASRLQARLWKKQRMFEEAKSEVLRALDMFEKLGAIKDVGMTRRLLRLIDLALEEMDLDPVTSDA